VRAQIEPFIQSSFIYWYAKHCLRALCASFYDDEMNTAVRRLYYIHHLTKSDTICVSTSPVLASMTMELMNHNIAARAPIASSLATSITLVLASTRSTSSSGR
jgi:hypothetical protein